MSIDQEVRARLFPRVTFMLEQHKGDPRKAGLVFELNHLLSIFDRFMAAEYLRPPAPVIIVTSQAEADRIRATLTPKGE